MTPPDTITRPDAMTRCDPAATGRPAADGSKLRKSRATRWRSAVLLAIHGVFLLHIWHLVTAGETISPIEPSEAMQLADRSIVNAGLIFFAVTILATLVFGRFFCGWACHMLALQDLCLAGLTKIGIRPKPLRSRALLWVPLAAALYMFAWPWVYRLWTGAGASYQGVALTTSDFWETFPHPAVAIATFAVCGFAVVYFLGAKGFCAYGCPYGAVFGLADRVAPGKIRVDDSCDSCGHCTVTCTSNVAVAQEVRDWGMVVDPGCMKCMDCVSVCPQGALSFGFGKIALGAKPRREPKPAKAKQSGREELLLLVLFVAAFFSVRGLWVMDTQTIPFLFSLGIAGIAACLGLVAVRLVTRERVGLQNWKLKREGRLTPAGKLAVAGLVLTAGLWIHTSLVRYREFRAAASMAELAPWSQNWFEPTRPQPAAEFGQAVALLGSDAEWLERWAFVEGGLNRERRIWVSIWNGDLAAAEDIATKALAKNPKSVGDGLLAGDLAALRGDTASALPAYALVLDEQPGRLDVVTRLVPLLVESDRAEEALERLDAALAVDPDAHRDVHQDAHPDELLLLLQRSTVLLVLHRSQEAEAQLRRAIEVSAGRPEPYELLAQVLLMGERVEEARELLSAPSTPRSPSLDELRRSLERR